MQDLKPGRWGASLQDYGLEAFCNPSSVQPSAPNPKQRFLLRELVRCLAHAAWVQRMPSEMAAAGSVDCVSAPDAPVRAKPEKPSCPVKLEFRENRDPAAQPTEQSRPSILGVEVEAMLLRGAHYTPIAASHLDYAQVLRGITAACRHWRKDTWPESVAVVDGGAEAEIGVMRSCRTRTSSLPCFTPGTTGRCWLQTETPPAGTRLLTSTMVAMTKAWWTWQRPCCNISRS